MADTSWRVRDILMDGLVGSQPSMSEGGTGSYTFRIDATETEREENAATYGPPDGGTFGQPDGFVYGGSPSGYLDRYERILDYSRHAGKVAIKETISGESRFREQHTEDRSLLVPIIPGDDVISGQAIWGLVMGVGDETVLPQRGCVVTLDIAYLADYREYPSEDALRSALEITGV